ncbi:anthranilate synthase [Saccharomycopsis crataegensis]|uniref:anthranilate synthase n=1 Tax=Saccharomycopsis crataegensis TaxID=43959 RepID=A0AAV5QGK3_9ASCO|nr:anthranilate synthase [Saccharomycopsis crataegensis]
MPTEIQPSLEGLLEIISKDRSAYQPTELPNLYPIYKYVPNDSLTPHIAYLKLAHADNRLNHGVRSPSFLFESAKNCDQIERFSFIGVKPLKTIKTLSAEQDESLRTPVSDIEEVGVEVDPLDVLEQNMKNFRQAPLPGIPALSGGAIGYISYDCIKYFEPKTRRELKDVLKLPESYLMLFNSVVAFDNVYQRLQIINNVSVEPHDTVETITAKYQALSEEINLIKAVLLEDDVVLPEQPPIVADQPFTSNIGQEGYEGHVKTLKDHILKGDIIQAVPSQRISRPTSLHPFNIYRHLRTVNPSPYLFYIDYLDFQIIGASPELLVKSSTANKVVTHPIAGTIRRGTTKDEDDALAHELKSSLKDRAEHIMLVDLARNDINRICDPQTTSVDKLLTIERFSHVMHLVSEVSGTLRPDKSRFDAFRSIFPAGTVSGAPKVKAMELIGKLEGERRGVYAGAVGHWGYDGRSMDTCIALRTMVYKDGVAYLQAGGGIVHDSDPYDEYIETMNKMKANNDTIVEAEHFWAQDLQK